MGAMYKTYELYLEGPEGPRGFEPFTCRSDAEAMEEAEHLLQARGLTAVEVRHFGSHVFTLTA